MITITLEDDELNLIRGSLEYLRDNVSKYKTNSKFLYLLSYLNTLDINKNPIE